MHICVSKQTIIGSDNGLSPGRRQAIIWTDVGILLIEPLGTNFGEILIKIITFSVKKMHLKMSSGNILSRPQWVKKHRVSYSDIITIAVHSAKLRYTQVSLTCPMRLQYSGKTAIPWLLMPWLFIKLYHQVICSHLTDYVGKMDHCLPWGRLSTTCLIWISLVCIQLGCNYMPRKVWDENTYPFLNFNGANYEV